MAPRFGLCTRLVHGARLEPRHLALMARHGFSTLELAATRTHFDYADPGAVQSLAKALVDAGLTLHAVGAPRAEGVRSRTWVVPFSPASDDAAERKHALDEIRLAIALAGTVPYAVLVVHLERPGTPGDAAPESMSSARKSLEEITRATEDAGVQLALASGGGPLSRPDVLVRIIERDLDEHRVGICLDYGHAHLHGGVADAIDEAGEHLIATHLPDSGPLPWDHAMMSTQKIGYDGVLTFDVDGGPDPEAALQRAARTRDRLADLVVAF